MSYQIPEYKNTLKWVSDGVAKSTGRKFLMGLTGLFLIVFLKVHLLGNLLLLKNDGGFSFNQYAKLLSDLKIMRIAEILLLAGFLLHISYGIIVTIQNRRARPVRYKMIRSAQTSSFFSRFMASSGALIFIFIGIHLNEFFVPHRILETDHTLYESTVASFKSLPNSLFYVFIMMLLSFHLLHGVQSAFQSLGVNHNKYIPLIRIVGFAYAIFVPALFAIIPIYIYFKG